MPIVNQHKLSKLIANFIPKIVNSIFNVCLHFLKKKLASWYEDTSTELFSVSFQHIQLFNQEHFYKILL